MSCQNPHNQKVAAVFGFAIRLASHPFLHPRLLRLVWVWWRSAILILTPHVPSKGKCCFEKIESEKSLCFRHLDFSLRVIDLNCCSRYSFVALSITQRTATPNEAVQKLVCKRPSGYLSFVKVVIIAQTCVLLFPVEPAQ